MANPNDFLLNTDYEMDKIVYVNEGKLLNPQTHTEKVELPFQPLLFGLCSFNEDFSAPKPIPFYQNPRFRGSPTPVIERDIAFTMTLDGQALSIVYRNNIDSNKPIYYRIYGLEPTTKNEKVPSTKAFTRMFTLNTDDNYRKLYKKGVVRIGEDITIRHNFGYVPQTMIWYDLPSFSNGYLTNTYSMSESSPVYATKEAVRIRYPHESGDIYNGAKIHYRIYYDEA